MLELSRSRQVEVQVTGRAAIGVGLPDLELTDHLGHPRRLSELVGDDPALLHFYRGWWCPKERQYFRRLVDLQDDAEVAYARFISVSVDPPEVQAAFEPAWTPGGRSCPMRRGAMSRSWVSTSRPTTCTIPIVRPVW